MSLSIPKTFLNGFWRRFGGTFSKRSFRSFSPCRSLFVTKSDFPSYPYIEILKAAGGKKKGFEMKATEKERITTLDKVRTGERGVIVDLPADGAVTGRLTGMGFCEGAEIECALAAPLGDPRAYLIRGALIAVRQNDAREIKIKI